MVEVVKIIATSFKRSHACTALPPTLKQATANPRLCQRLLDTHGHVWVSFCGVIICFSWVLVHTSLCALQKSVSLVLCKLLWFYGWVIGNLLQEGLCHTQVCCIQGPCSRPLLTRTSTGNTQTQFWLSLCGLGKC